MNINFESTEDIGIENIDIDDHRRHRLATKQPLSNFEPQKTWKYKQL